MHDKYAAENQLDQFDFKHEAPEIAPIPIAATQVQPYFMQPAQYQAPLQPIYQQAPFTYDSFTDLSSYYC